MKIPTKNSFASVTGGSGSRSTESTSSKTFVFDENTVFPLFHKSAPVSFVAAFLLVERERKMVVGVNRYHKSDGTNAKKLANNCISRKNKGFERFARTGHISWSLATGREDQVRHTEFFFRRVLGFSKKKIHFSFLIEFL